MRSHQRRIKRRITRGIPIFLFVGVIVLSIFVTTTDSPFPGKRVVLFVAQPLLALERIFLEETASLAGQFSSKESLLRETNRLQAQINSLKEERLKLELLEVENKQLKEALGRESSVEIVLAGILSRPNRTLYDTFLIDAGSLDGIRRGDIARTTGGLVVGTVESVTERSAQVSLFSTPGRSTEVHLGVVGPALVALGRGSGNFGLRIPRGVPVSEGDVLFLPGIENGAIGVVGAVREDPVEAFIDVFARIPRTLATLRFLEIVIHE